MDKLNYQINFIGIIAAPRKSKPLFEREKSGCVPVQGLRIKLQLKQLYWVLLN